jgi:quercetin dioxygenase-like cupin family protein
MDIKRFGPGHRRADGPPGTQGVAGVVIYRDERALISELAFQRYAIVTPHANQSNTALFIVISGGGYVQVGDERARVNHGEAVVWPPGLVHGAYTDGTEMRALVVELISDGPATEISGMAASLELPDGAPASDAAAAPVAPTRAQGELEERKVTREEYDSNEGEPW